MEWTSDEMNAAAGDYLKHGFHPDALRRIMTRAVELVAARGGTMTAEDIASATENGYWGAALRQHIAAQGARIAVLESALSLAPAGAEAKAEAMRAACLEAVQHVLQGAGYDVTDHTWSELKAAIEGAAP